MMMMMIRNDESTISTVWIDGKFICFGLEDPFQEEKIYGQTRIPEGEYEINVRTHGGFHNRYLKDPRMKNHQGMLHIRDVPDFKHILIHVGNSNQDTKGCLLLGSGVSLESMKISNSVKAYNKFYKLVIEAALDEELYINFYDEDK
jgi:hypothetical protein